MKLTFNFGNAVAVLPAKVLQKLDKATKKDIKLIFALASMGSSLIFDEKDIPAVLSEATGMNDGEIRSSLAFWRGAGVLEVIGGENERQENVYAEKVSKADSNAPNSKNSGSGDETAEKKSDVKLRSSDEVPRFTTEEFNDLLDRKSEYKALIEECQRLFGKVFVPAECNLLVSFSEYLGLDSEYIMLLFAHCGKKEHKSVRAVEKLALRFLDEGIEDAATLNEKLHFLEQAGALEGRIRQMFGISSRALTKREKGFVEKWLRDYKFDFEIIEKAYEVTIDSTGKPSLPYAASVLDRWYSEGLRSTEAIEKNLSDFRNEKKSEKESERGSFDTEAAFEAALKRSFEKK